MIIDDEMNDVEDFQMLIPRTVSNEFAKYIQPCRLLYIYKLSNKKQKFLNKKVTAYNLVGITGSEFLRDLKQIELYSNIPAAT